ncbi:hypothetical protein LR48_Vigan10g131800 [Vigna angularis]|nr:hypothetical protein LR48_Vigan10g131800 [Vigna angularis]
MTSKLNLNMRNDGFVKVNDLLKLNMKTFANIPLRSHIVDDIKENVLGYMLEVGTRLVGSWISDVWCKNNKFGVFGSLKMLPEASPKFVLGFCFLVQKAGFGVMEHGVKGTSTLYLGAIIK